MYLNKRKNMNLLEIGKILRPHGIKGAVKIESYIDEPFSQFKSVIIGKEKQDANLFLERKSV